MCVCVREHEHVCLHVRMRVMQVCTHRARVGMKNGEGETGKDGDSVCVREQECVCVHVRLRACACVHAWGKGGEVRTNIDHARLQKR